MTSPFNSRHTMRFLLTPLVWSVAMPLGCQTFQKLSTGPVSHCCHFSLLAPKVVGAYLTDAEAPHRMQSCIMHMTGLVMAEFCFLHGLLLQILCGCTGAIEADTRPGQALALSQTAPVITKSVWQCGSGYQELTERVQLLNFDFSQPLASSQGSAAIRHGALI